MFGSNDSEILDAVITELANFVNNKLPNDIYTFGILSKGKHIYSTSFTGTILRKYP